MRLEAFTVDSGVFLLRHVVPRSGEPYIHSCTRENFEIVAHTIEELNGASFKGEEIVAATGLPSSQVSTAVAFLNERGILDSVFRRRLKAATEMVYIDAMTEFFALYEETATVGACEPLPTEEPSNGDPTNGNQDSDQRAC